MAGRQNDECFLVELPRDVSRLLARLGAEEPSVARAGRNVGCRVILTDREIENSLDSGLIEIEPRPAADAYSSTSVDLTLAPTLRVFRKQTIGVEAAIDPTAAGYNVVT